MIRSVKGVSGGVRWAAISAVAFGSLAGLSACSGSNEDSAPAAESPTAAHSYDAGIIRITVDGLGSQTPTASAENVSEESAVSGGLHARKLSTQPCFVELSSAPVSGGAFSVGSEQYVSFTFQVRNAQGTTYTSGSTSCTNGTANTSTISNVSLVGIYEPGSGIDNTPFILLQKFDGTNAAASIAPTIIPTHGLAFNPATEGLSVVPGEESLQVFTEGQIAGITIDPEDAAGTYLFPYGYVVHNVNPALGRTLQANPAAGEYDGQFTFAVKLPIQSTKSNSVYKFTIDLQALTDTDTRVTQSTDEQTPIGDIAANLRALNLDTTDLVALGGSHVTATNIGDPICTVRIAGPASAPTAYLVQNTTANVASAPYNLSGLSPTGSINAGFCQPMTTPSSIYSQFAISGSQSGAKPTSTYGAFAGGGTDVLSFTPTTAHPFFPGEQVSYSLTSNLVSVNSASPAPFVGSFTVGGLMPSYGAFVSRTQPGTYLYPYSVAIADFNKDGIPDLAIAAGYAYGVEVLFGNGDGTYRVAPGSPFGDYGGLAVVAADFNGDGSPDLAIVTNTGPGTVSILTNDGSGGFTLTSSLSVQYYPSGMVTADFNGDGHPDLAVLNAFASSSETGDGSVSILTNNGSGGFTVQSSSTGVGVNAVAIATADFNGDRHPDLAVVTQNSGGDGTVSILTNNGSGGFNPSSSTTVGDGPEGIVAADFNADGHADLAVSNYSSGTVSILTNNGSGAFAVSSSPSAPYGEKIAAGDFNGDGRPDLAVTDYLDGTVSILINSSSSPGTFALSTSPGVGTAPFGISAADLNGDGHLDLVVANVDSSSVSILLNENNGTFAPPPLPEFSPVSTAAGGAPYAIAAADFNADGRLDYAVTNYGGSGTVSVFLAQATGGYVQAGGSPFSVGADPFAIVAGDFNNDGSPDLAVLNEYASGSSSGNGTVSLLINNGSGDFTPTVSVGVGSNPSAITMADFNGDGYPDLAVTNNASSGTVSILTNSSSSPGTFSLTSSPAVGEYPNGLVAADFNGDGHPDLAVANSYASGSSAPGGTVSILTNNGTGGFTLKASPPSGTYSTGVAAGDFNGDGSIDLAVINCPYNNCSVGTVSILLNMGSNAFTLSSTLPVGNTPASIATGDFNGDGYPDLAVVNYGSNSVSILLGSGQGSFSNAPYSQVGVGSLPRGVAVGDFFGTHKLALAIANSGENKVTIVPQK